MYGGDEDVRELDLLAEATGLRHVAVGALDGVVDHHEGVERVAEVAAGLAVHAAALQLVLEVVEEVGRGAADRAGEAHVGELAHGAHQRVAAAAGDDEGVHARVGVVELLRDVGALGGRGVGVDGVGQGDGVAGVRGVPLLDALLVALPALLEGGVADGPTLELEVAGALLDALVGLVVVRGEQRDELLAVVDLVLVDGADVVLRALGEGVDVGGGVLGDHAVELGEVDLVVVAGVDGGGHLGVRGVADDDALAAGGAQRLDGGGHLLGDVALVDRGDLDAEDVGGLLDDVDGELAERVGRAPDGNADLDVVTVRAAAAVRAAAPAAAGQRGAARERAHHAGVLEEVPPRERPPSHLCPFRNFPCCPAHGNHSLVNIALIVYCFGAKQHSQRFTP